MTASQNTTSTDTQSFNMSSPQVLETSQQEEPTIQDSKQVITMEESRFDDSGADSPLETARPQNAFWTHMTATVKPSFIGEFELILLTIFTGMQDAVTYPDYHCFASNQTGNTVFLMLAIFLPELNNDMFITANIGVALGFFLAGGWLTGQLGHIAGPRCRLWLIVCNLIQSLMVLACGAMQYLDGVHLKGTNTLIILALLSFASGSQVVQSRSLAMTEISTAMATAAWVDLLIDKRLFALQNRPRNRRVCFLICLVLGAILGALIYRSVGSGVAVLISGGGKVIVTFLYLFNESEQPKVEKSMV